MSGCPIRVAVVGAGNRATIYSKYSLGQPGDVKIVAVVEPNDFRRRKFADTFNIPAPNTFKSLKDFLGCGKIADAVINGTTEKMHVSTSIPLLKAGYSVLLEKPIGIDINEVMRLYSVAKETKKTVMICHVLRYAPFYKKIKEYISAGYLGNIINIQMSENVSYHHMAASFIRGKWHNGQISSMLMSKCCHDFDLLVWLKKGMRPVKVVSYGSLIEFEKGKKPRGAGTRCLVDCEIEKDCIYSARKLYLEHPERWTQYVWNGIEKNGSLSDKDREISLRTDNPQGCCVWDTDNSDVVDHQSVMVEFEDGSTATHNLTCGAARGGRYIHIIGTKGEIQGCFEDNRFEFRRPMSDAKNKMGFESANVLTDTGLDGHGGGDMHLVEDFINVLKGCSVSQAATLLEDSILGYALAYNAEISRKQGRTVNMRNFLKNEKLPLAILSFSPASDVHEKTAMIDNYCDAVSQNK